MLQLALNYGATEPAAKYVSSPAVVNGVVYIGSEDGNVYALNAATGASIWNYPTGGFVKSSPAVAGNVVYFASWDNNVYALNAASGAEIWSYATDGEVTSSPAVAEGGVYIGGLDGNVYAFGQPWVSVSPSSVVMDVGQSQQFTATPSDGSGTYTSYQWYVNGNSQSGQTASTFNYLASSGTYSITAIVTDSQGTPSQMSSAADRSCKRFSNRQYRSFRSRQHGRRPKSDLYCYAPWRLRHN